PFLEIKNVKKRFANVDVLKGIDISIEPGAFLVLAGPSGCAKSTFINLLAGLDAITEGDIHINGARVNDLHPSKRDIAMVFQSYALYPNMTVAQNIVFGLEMRGARRGERDRAVPEGAKTLQTPPRRGQKPSQLSGGQ